MNAWQPISTAPKEGSFIVWCPERQNMFIVSGRDRFEGRFRIFGADVLLGRQEPTHWMPWPASPQESEL